MNPNFRSNENVNLITTRSGKIIEPLPKKKRHAMELEVKKLFVALKNEKLPLYVIKLSFFRMKK